MESAGFTESLWRLMEKKPLVVSFSLVVGPQANLQPTIFLKVEFISIWLKIIFWLVGIFFFIFIPVEIDDKNFHWAGRGNCK